MIIICSSKLAVFFERLPQKTVRFSEELMSADKFAEVIIYPYKVFTVINNCMAKLRLGA